MDNQHKKIKGYRDLSQKEIDMMNEGKDLAEKVGYWIRGLEAMKVNFEDSSVHPDKDWLQKGKMDLQTGFSEVIRSIAKPTTF